MDIFIASLLLIGMAILAMSLGLFFGRLPLRGTCGGIGPLAGRHCATCSVCGQGQTEAMHADTPAPAQEKVRDTA